MTSIKKKPETSASMFCLASIIKTGFRWKRRLPCTQTEQKPTESSFFHLQFSFCTCSRFLASFCGCLLSNIYNDLFVNFESYREILWCLRFCKADVVCYSLIMAHPPAIAWKCLNAMSLGHRGTGYMPSDFFSVYFFGQKKPRMWQTDVRRPRGYV